MNYEFDKIVDRRGTNCVKYDKMPDGETIALWVADMDFETAPVIRKAIEQRARHGCFGYTHVPESFFESIQWWFQHRHGWQIQRSSLLYTTGVVPAVSAILKALTLDPLPLNQPTPNTQHPTPKVLVQTPAYNCFFSSVRNNGFEIAENRLEVRGERYEVNWEDFEAKCADNDVCAFILCNPQNPTGRVWTKEELTRMADICARHNVFVIADEIHCEFTAPQHPYTPFASLETLQEQIPCGYQAGNANIIHPSLPVSNSTLRYAVCMSPSKAFNIAGLQIALISCNNEQMRQLIDKAININEVCDVNPFGVLALQAAYTPEGEEWLTGLNAYIRQNYDTAKEFIEHNLPQWKLLPMEGTYLAWVDISQTGKTSKALADEILHKANVYVNAGEMYGSEAGRNYIRLNLALPKVRLQEALQRCKAAF